MIQQSCELGRRRISAFLVLLWAPLGFSGGFGSASAQDDLPFEVDSNLKAGVGKVEITPEGVTHAYGHPRPVEGVRDPLQAAVLVLDDSETRAAIVTLDLLHASDALVQGVRQVVSEAADVPSDQILVAVSHNHSGADFESNERWMADLLEKVGGAARAAAGSLRTVSIGYAEDEIGFGINRRKVINGKAVVRLNPNGPNDERVKVLRFDDGRSVAPMAVLMHCVCHPCFFTWGDDVTPPYPDGYPKLSADFPGEAQRFVERAFGGRTTSLFLQGCAGDIRPNLPGDPYRCADEADLQWAGFDLGGAVVRAAARAAIREERAERSLHFRIRCARKVVELPAKNGGTVAAELMAMKIGPYLLLTMPGEPIVEMGLQMESILEDRAVPIIVGYANGSIGYIATAEAHKYGGYEPEVSRLAPEAEQAIYKELELLADEVIGDVFRVFSKHPEEEDEEAED